MRREEFDHPGLCSVADAFDNNISKAAMKLLSEILAEFCSEDYFILAELEEVSSSKKVKENLDFLCKEGLIQEEDGCYYINHNHPVIVAQSTSLSDMIYRD